MGDIRVRVARLHLRCIGAVAVLSAAVGLAGCGADSALLDTTTSLAEPAAARPPTTTLKPIARTIAFRTAMGPPDDINAELTKQLNEAAIEQGIALVVDPSVPMDVTLRGYISAIPKGSNVNVMYLWDVVDSRGQRLNRISGEEALGSGAGAGQPWSAVTPQVTKMIAAKTMAELGRWAKANSTPAPGNVSAPAAPAGAGAASLAVQPPQ